MFNLINQHGVTAFFTLKKSEGILTFFPFAILRGFPLGLGPTNPCLFANVKETFSTTAFKAIQ